MKHNNIGFSRALAITISTVCLFSVIPGHAAAVSQVHGDTVTVRAHAFTRNLTAYGQIEPIALVRVRAQIPGSLSHLSIVPGDSVHANDELAELIGPRITSLLTNRQELLHSAQAQERAAIQSLRIVEHKFSAQLSTRQRLDTAKSHLVAAQAAVRIAQARLDEAKQMQQLRSPVDATVMSVQATNGEQTVANETIVTLMPWHRLWLRAEYYGADIEHVHIGMTGEFHPSDHGQAIPVRVIAIAPNLNPDTGKTIELLPIATASSTSWINGQWGKLTLTRPSQQYVSVPTSALILDRGHWWVLVHTPAGDKPQEVIPGAAHGWSTAILDGLQPGQNVVVKNAFLRYHRGIAQSYMPPD